MNNSHAGPLALGAMLRVEGILGSTAPKAPQVRAAG